MRNAESCFDEILRLVSSLLRSCSQRITFRYGITQVKLLDDIVADASASEILFADGDAIGVVLQYVMEVTHCPFIDN